MALVGDWFMRLVKTITSEDVGADVGFKLKLHLTLKGSIAQRSGGGL